MWPFVFLALASCGAYDSAKSGVKSVAGWVGGTIVEYSFCEIGLLDCGHVYVCGGLELCIDDGDEGVFEQAEAELGECKPTERHQGICVDTCMEPSPLPDGRGANAFHGAYCGDGA